MSWPKPSATATGQQPLPRHLAESQSATDASGASSHDASTRAPFQQPIESTYLMVSDLHIWNGFRGSSGSSGVPRGTSSPFPPPTPSLAPDCSPFSQEIFKLNMPLRSCSIHSCINAAERSIGSCMICGGSLCSEHVVPQLHQCPSLVRLSVTWRPSHPLPPWIRLTC